MRIIFFLISESKKVLPGSVIMKGKSLNILSSQEGRAAGLHGRSSSLLQHHYRHCEDITPERSSALRNDNFPTILERRGGPGESRWRPRKCEFLLLVPGKESAPAVSAGAGAAGKRLGVQEPPFPLLQREKCCYIF